MENGLQPAVLDRKEGIALKLRSLFFSPSSFLLQRYTGGGGSILRFFSFGKEQSKEKDLRVSRFVSLSYVSLQNNRFDKFYLEKCRKTLRLDVSNRNGGKRR